MTLGHVYDLDLKKNESLIKEVIIQAQGEVSNLCYNIKFFSNDIRWHWRSISNKSKRPGRVTP